MAPLNILLAHIVADHSFTNNTKIRKYSGIKLLGHIVWSFLALLAFCFDTVFKTLPGTTLFLSFFALHAVVDLLRPRFQTRKCILNLLEVISLSGAIVVNLLSFEYLKGSFVSPEFVFYLLGMSIVAVGPTYFLRNFYSGKEDIEDLDGISERLAIFIFLIAGRFELVALSVVGALLYRLIFVKKPDHVWWISPTFGLLISVLWKWMLYS
ncbi:MAG: hypothetical protein DRP33_02185 [Thermotogae bacterium]|nr:MAG: hypothetical protein DRP33_02185 [Thermotogota bacterium]